MKNLLVLDSRHKTNVETDGFTFKFKLNQCIKINGSVRLEQFIFQNSQYVFSKEKKSDRFIYIDNTGFPTTVTITGKFDTIDDFVKHFNSITSGLNIKMIYIKQLYEIQIQHLQGNMFSLTEYYTDGTLLSLIGFDKCQGNNVYTNTSTPKLFSQSLIYISIPELGVYNAITQGSKPYTFLVLSQQGFEIVSNINNTFANTFHVSDKNLDELTIQIRGSDGLPFVNNKGNANVIMILSY